MMEVLAYIQEFNAVSIFIRLLLAVFIGGLIGAEREARNQTAGIRIFALVCLGAALAMITNEYLTLESGNQVDSSRMAAQVISGIGFLGVGTIIVTGNNKVKGLTTAAGLWVVATIGIAIGSGFLYGALLGFVFTFISIKSLHYFSRWMESHNRLMEFYIEIDQQDGIKKIQNYMSEKGFTIKSIQRTRQKAINREDICLTVEVDIGKRQGHESLIRDIEQLKGVHYVEEMH